MPEIVSVVGSPDSGKTTLIEKLVPILMEKGLRVVVIKHHAHGDFDFDEEGKDSWKLYQAGADVVVASPFKITLIRKSKDIYDLDYVVERYLKDYDLVLTEGFNRHGKPRIVVLRPGDDISRFKIGKILAIVCERDVESYPTYRLTDEDVFRIAELIFQMVS
jgi:molybdopterin-guanine dinucleotide biosynthesis protein B